MAPRRLLTEDIGSPPALGPLAMPATALARSRPTRTAAGNVRRVSPIDPRDASPIHATKMQLCSRALSPISRHSVQRVEAIDAPAECLRLRVCLEGRCSAQETA